MKFDAGPEKGNTNLAIYELKGNTWRLCLSTHGAGRPSSFASPPGSGIALETLSRGKAPESAKGKQPRSENWSALTQNDGRATVFEGDWRLVSALMDGKPMEESAIQWVKRVTRGNRMTVYAGPQVMLQVEFTSDPSRSPKTIDYLNIGGPNKGKTQLGIYELEGDLLKFHVAAPGAARPTISTDRRASAVPQLPGNASNLVFQVSGTIVTVLQPGPLSRRPSSNGLILRNRPF